MGIFGAALATVLSRGIGTIFSLTIITVKYKLIDWKFPGFRLLFQRWMAALHVAAPSAANHLLMPLGTGFVTRMVADFGNQSVAAVGAAGRLMHLLYLIPIALGSVLVPFSGQNWGAGKYNRVKDAWNKSNRFSLYYGLVSFIFMIFTSRYLAMIFGEGEAFIWTFVVFLLFTIAASGLQHVGVHSGFVLNAIGYPLSAFTFNAGRVFLLMCPLTWLGKVHLGITGVFAGLHFLR